VIDLLNSAICIDDIVIVSRYHNIYKYLLILVQYSMIIQVFINNITQLLYLLFVDIR
jgi:hypothetical protein